MVPGSPVVSCVFLFLSVHRIGRTGRCGKTGIATTFINKGCGRFNMLLVYNVYIKFISFITYVCNVYT